MFYPSINDVTTTPEAPPAFVALAGPSANKGRDMGYPPGNMAVQRRAYGDLAPLALAKTPAAVFPAAAAAAKAMTRWTVVSEDAAAARIEAVAVTLLMRYRDDIAIEVRATSGGCAVHVRSKSRLGRGDFGANAKRIRAYLSALGASL